MYSSTAGTDISFELNDSPFVKVLPPFQQKVLTQDMLSTSHIKIFYTCPTRASDLVGSVKPGPNNSSSSVIMASNGELVVQLLG